jgi:predicted acetyltransferase
MVTSERVRDGRDSHDVTLEVAAIHAAPVLANLLELYLHDMSEVFPIEIRPDGRFGYDKLPLYWSEPNTHFAFFIRSGAQAGRFALVTRGSPATVDPQDLDLAEFFILRSYRRAGIGRRAAFSALEPPRRRWVVRVAEANPVGLSFWEATIRDYTRGAFSTGEHRGKHHLFRVFSFRSANLSAAV